MELARYCVTRPLPPYSYVPGLAPHPISDSRGHSFGHIEPPPRPLDERSYSENATYLHALDLFNHGFYWESHEVWESLWHAAGRSGATADFLKGLIKLAAAGVKAREGRAAGVRQHAQRAAELFRSVERSETNGDGTACGLRLDDLLAAASSIAVNAERLAGSGPADASRTLPLVLRLG